MKNCGDLLCHHLVRAVAQQALCHGIEAGYDSLGGRGNDGVVGAIQDRLLQNGHLPQNQLSRTATVDINT